MTITDPAPARVDPDRCPAASVTVYPDGPLVVRGDVEVRNADGTTVVSRQTVALCRCGRSAQKPYCDGSHKIATRAAARAAAAGSTPRS